MKILNNLLWIAQYAAMLMVGNMQRKKVTSSTDNLARFTKNLNEQITRIKDAIRNPDVKVVSFDIFDTLLYRPCLYPTDLFYLIANKVNPLYNINFISLRLYAELLLRNPYASLQDIYQYIEKRSHVNHDIIQKLQEEEMACEKQILAVRQDIKNLYEYARTQSKRIIAVSDMYLPSSFLREVLQQNGYHHIAKVYVSTEYKAVKYDGSLFEKVLQEEHIRPQEMVHIGDNKKADVIAPCKKNIHAFHYPSIKNLIFQRKNYKTFWRLFPRLSLDPVTRIFLSFSLFQVFQDSTRAPKEPFLMQTMEQFVYIGLAPIAFFTAHFIATCSNIQKTYKRIHFAARDGFLPKMVYDMLRERYPDLLPSNYLYASRRAYFPLSFQTVEEFIKKSVDKNTLNDLSWGEFLEHTLVDKGLLVRIREKIPSATLKSTVRNNFTIGLRSLQIVHNELQTYLEKIRANTLAYYMQQFENSIGREIVFDLGYNGSISKALSTITNLYIDKIYVWQTPKSKEWDKAHHTRTFCPTNFLTLYRLGVHLIYEELFSPLQGGCVSFNEQKEPILEDSDFPKQMQDVFALVQATTRQFTTDICNRFGSYLPYLTCKDTTSLHNLNLYLLGGSPFGEREIFKDVKFPDPLTCGVTVSLTEKLLLLHKRSLINRGWTYIINRFV